VLLQVLDDGRLTDSKGRTVDFKNTVLIMTSNLGAHLLQGENLNSDAAFEAVRDQVMDVVRQSFRPEFLNRVDDIVLFQPLGEEQLGRIVDLRLADLRRLLADRKITLELTEAARHQLLLTGYDRQYGARPLKRAIQRLIQDPLAIKILDGEVLNGDVVRVDADPLNNQLRFEVVERSAEAPQTAAAHA
jgi:ATP-dependent Clp protease ATP-binding subunit ClpB